jgi:hypothetical protein
MTKHALLAGVERTIVTGFPDQKTAVTNDLELIRSLLMNNNWSENNIRILRNDGDLTKENFLTRMSDLADSAHPGDRLFLYFSGHAVEHSFQESSFQSLVLYDSFLHDYEIRKVLKKTDAGAILITIFDCCHSGSIIDFSPQINFPATLYFGACKDPQEAISYPGGSLFTSTIYSIVEQSGQITYSDLKKQIMINIQEPKPVFIAYRVSNNYLEQNFVFS